MNGILEATRRGRFLLPTAFFLAAGCCEAGVHEVEMDLHSANFGTPGDTATAFALALQGTRMPCGILLYSSQSQPYLFSFSSTDQTVATIDSNGLVRMLKPGVAFVSAVTAGIASPQNYVIVSPRTSTLTLTALQASAHVGDTVQFRVEAFDSTGAPLGGAYTYINLLPGNMGQALPSNAVEQWSYPAPAVIRVIAKQPGSLRMVAFTDFKPTVMSNRDSVPVAP